MISRQRFSGRAERRKASDERQRDSTGGLRRSARRGAFSLALWLFMVASAHAQNGVVPETPVGVAGQRYRVVIAGSEVEVVPLEDRKSPVRLRIVDVYPHGAAFRYDLEYQGLQPGTFDLKDYLRRKDGSAMTEAPALPVKVIGILPPGQVEPNALQLGNSPVAGGYFILQIIVGSIGCLGLLLSI